MPDISATNVLTVTSAGTSYTGETFTSLRDATTGSSTDDTSDGQDIGYTHASARGGHFYNFHRVFAAFDTSGISVTPAVATLKIYGKANPSYMSNADFFVVKGTQGSGDPSTADFDAIAGWDTTNAADGRGNGDQEGNVTKYTAEWVNGTTAWDESDYNELILTSDALDDMASLTAFYICIIESTHDLNDDNATVALLNGMYFDGEYQDREPVISYTAGAAGYGHNVIGVASANISAVNGVATANISKVNGV